jgi:hypothetical protein
MGCPFHAASITVARPKAIPASFFADKNLNKPLDLIGEFNCLNLSGSVV